VKNLYINGCSFTAGHLLPIEQTWPVLLSEKLGTKLINQAINGQSFDSIFLNTINHLSMLNSKDTLVVIGTTWPNRHSVMVNKYITNITSPDLNAGIPHKKRKIDFGDKISIDRRTSSPYYIDTENIKKLTNEYRKQEEVKNSFDQVCRAYADYFESLVRYDDNLHHNQWINLISKVVALQGFLEKNNFDYRFVDFYNIYRYKFENHDFWKYPITELIDDTKIILFDAEWREKYVGTKAHGSHPSDKGCVNVSEVLYDSFNR
tara:strand:- start:3888 stop:4673 length:786 start_codon:yes stop_codon:yes gene_type:complete